MVPPAEETRALPPTDGDKTAMPAAAAQRSNAGAAVSDSSESVLALPVGTRLHEFEITGVIGEGGFGIVYAAHDHSLDRAVAVKEYMPGALAHRTQGVTVSVRSERHRETFQLGMRSFVNEAKLLARFDHPSLVKVHRFWEANGTAYMAMPHYHGETLKSRLKALSAAPDEAWLRTLLASVLDALAVIHGENVFHRDIAPDNIMLLEGDIPVLLDFGAARRVIGDATQGLTVILKPGYAPIEQYAEVKSMKQGAWTDIYALAATVYFSITGKPPEPAVARMISDSLVPMAQAGRGRYSESFLTAMDAALQVKPEQRPQDVAAFRVLLGMARHPASAAAHKRGPAPAANTAGRGGMSRLPLFAGIATLLIAAAAGAYFYLGQGAAPVAAPVPSEKPVAVSPPPTPVAETPPPAPAAPPAPAVTAAEPELRTPAAAPETVAVPSPKPAAPPETLAAPQPPRVQTPPPAMAKAPPAATAERPVARVERTPPAPELSGQPQGAAVDQEAYRQPAPARDNVQVTSLVAQAQQSLARREFRRAAGLAENVLALDPSNVQARDIRRRAQEGEKRAFDEIKIE